MPIRSKMFPVVLLLLFVSLGAAQEKKIEQTPIRHTSPASGQEMYTQYCAACHGQDGKGGGPAATALKGPVPDLTTLAQRNGGKFPADQVASVLRFGTAVPAHGNSDMPIWGPLFGSLNKAPGAEVQGRIANLTQYIKSLQAK